MNYQAAKRQHNLKLRVDCEQRPGWITGQDRMPAVGEEVFCTMGMGEVTALHGKTGDGSRLLQIRLSAPGAAPFYAAASNVLLRPVSGAVREQASLAGSPAADAAPETWLG